MPFNEAHHEEPPLIDVQIGDTCLIEPQGLGERFKTVFIGWEKGRYIILKLPSKLELREHLFAGKSIIVRYLSCAGEVSGFASEIQGVNYKPQHLFFTDYPAKIEIFSLRKESRVDCFLPATIVVQGEKRLSASILNISKGGCRMGVSKADLMGHVFTVDQTFLCEFLILGQSGMPNSFMGQVRTISKEADKIFLGVQFQDVSETLKRQIEGYVTSVGNYLGGTCIPRY